MDNMQLWLSSSTDSINLNDSAEGFYLNPDLEGLTGLPEIRSVNGLNAGYDGGWTATQLWAARLITIRGVIAINDKAAVETKRKALAKLLAQGKSEDLELRFVSEAGNTYTTTVRTTGCTMALQRVFWRQEYQIQLRANDPLIYDDGGSELVAILRVMAGEGGFEIPFNIPFTIGGSIEPTSVDVGDEATYPLIRLKGDLHNPTIINMTTNQRMQVLADIIATVEWRDYTTTYTTNGFAQINDGIDGAPLSLTHLFGNATQETLSGKNLVNVLPQTYTNAGILWTITDSTITGSGTTTGTTSFLAPDWTPFPSTLPIGTYTFSIPQAISCDIDLVTRNSNNQQWNTAIIPAGQTSITVNQPRDMVDFKLALVYMTTSQSVSINIPNKIQFESGSTKTAYEQYCGGVPSPNPNYPQDVETVSGAQTVKITGKNLFDKSEAPISVSANTSVSELPTGVRLTLGATGTYRNARYMTGVQLAVGQSITVSGTITPSGTNNGRIAIATCDANGDNRATREYVNTSGSKTFTLTSAMASTPYIQLYFYSNLDSETSQPGDYIDYTDVQLELGSTATNFEPYQSQSQVINLGTLELAKIGAYQDYIWNDGGTWKIHKEVGKVVLDGSEAGWGIFGNNNAFYSRAYDVQIPSSTTMVGAIMANYYTAVSEPNIYNARVDYGIGIASQSRFLIRNKDITTVANLKTWLGTHNTTVYYALATPTDTEITDSGLIEQLNHIYELYQGTNNLWLIPSAGAQGEIEVSYATTEDIDYHEVVIDCQARTVTQDGHNLYPALAEGSEFIRLLPGENKLYLTSEVESDNGTAEVKFKKGNISI